MCNHYSTLKDAELVRRQFGVPLPAGEWKTDVYPGDCAPIIRRAHSGPAGQADEPGQREAVLARFGLIPWFAKSEKLAYSTMNARTETAATTASYRRPFRQRQWCIVPAQRFFEPYYDLDAWNAGARKSQRHAIARADGESLGIAGLWESWQRSAQDPDPLVSFTLLTLNADAHPLLQRFHKPFNEAGQPNEKRTIALLREADFDVWLGTSPAEAPRFYGTFEVQELVAGPA